jgi:RNA polymerase sigma-70 factor (ECF subfamily)
MLEEREPTDAALTDEVVLARSEQEPDLFKVIIKRHEAAFFRRARRILGDREEVTDAVTETFAKIYLKADRFKKQTGASFRSWAYQILFNTCCDYYRRLKLDENWLASYQAASQPVSVADERAAADGWRDLVWTTLTRLPANFSSLLRSYFIEGRSQKEIAQAEGVSVGAIKTRLYRAKQAFKKMSLASYYD